MKLNLTAKVPNEGARLVAQWVMGLPGGLMDARVQLDTGEDRVQRIVDGEMVPGMAVGQRLATRAGADGGAASVQIAWGRSIAPARPCPRAVAAAAVEDAWARAQRQRRSG